MSAGISLFAEWQRRISAAADNAGKLDAFREAALDVGRRIGDGFDHVEAVDRLKGMALNHSWFGIGEPDIEAMIGDGLERAKREDAPSVFDDMEERWERDDQQRARKNGKPPDDKAGDKAPLAGLGEWDAGDDADLPPPRGWLLGNSFCRKFISSLLGDGGTGKTAARTLQALALATGRNLTGEHVFERTRVLLISLEDDHAELRRRVLAARLHHKIELSEVNGWLFLSAPGITAGKLMTINSKSGGLVVGELAANIEAVIVKRQIGLVILDPFIKAHGVPENANAEMDAVAQMLTDIATRHNIGLDLPHHISKGAPDPGNANRGRGASATKDAGRLVFTLSPMSEDEAERYSIPPDDRRDYVRMDRAKLNIARTAGPAAWFKLISVRLGNATATYPNGDDVQTVEPWNPPQTWDRVDGVYIDSILTKIDHGLEDGTLYTHSPRATERAAWRVVCEHGPGGKSEAQARDIINTWVRTGLLVEVKYDNKVTRKPAMGLRVDREKWEEIRRDTTAKGLRV